MRSRSSRIKINSSLAASPFTTKTFRNAVKIDICVSVDAVFLDELYAELTNPVFIVYSV